MYEIDVNLQETFMLKCDEILSIQTNWAIYFQLHVRRCTNHSQFSARENKL